MRDAGHAQRCHSYFHLGYTPPWLFALSPFYSYPYDKPVSTPSSPLRPRLIRDTSPLLLQRYQRRSWHASRSLLMRHIWAFCLTTTGPTRWHCRNFFFLSFRPPSSCKRTVRTVAPKKKSGSRIHFCGHVYLLDAYR
jgi:hypothetical protein